MSDHYIVQSQINPCPVIAVYSKEPSVSEVRSLMKTHGTQLNVLIVSEEPTNIRTHKITDLL